MSSESQSALWRVLDPTAGLSDQTAAVPGICIGVHF